MKKCPSCNRAYSNAVSLCPSCGIELVATSGSGSSIRANGNPEGNNVETQTKKVVDHGNENKKTVVSGWKISSVVFMMLAMLFAGLYAIQLSEYDDMESKYNRKNREYNSLNEEYEELEKVIALYDLEGKYAIELTSVYNGDSDKKQISKDLPTSSLKYVCMKWTVHSFSEEWDDMIYINVIRPDGSVMTPQKEYNYYTTRDDLRDKTGSSQGREWSWADQSWKKGTYQVVFVQAESVIASFEIEVT